MRAELEKKNIATSILYGTTNQLKYCVLIKRFTPGGSSGHPQLPFSNQGKHLQPHPEHLSGT